MTLNFPTLSGLRVYLSSTAQLGSAKIALAQHHSFFVKNEWCWVYIIPVIFIFFFSGSALAEPLWVCMDSQSGVETFTHTPKSSDSVKCSPFDERQAKPMPIEQAQPKSVKNKKQKSTSSVKRKPTPKPVTMGKKKSTKRRS